MHAATMHARARGKRIQRFYVVSKERGRHLDEDKLCLQGASIAGPAAFVPMNQQLVNGSFVVSGGSTPIPMPAGMGPENLEPLSPSLKICLNNESCCAAEYVE